ncbi:hypothetical protein [Thalassobaculum sp.]|uniref:hypothetical protein n=1 Tax=Thalassobaculum sp. TaxID=2022740 RepID=UPI0032ED591A
MSSNVPDRSLDLLAGRVFDIPEPQFVDLVRSLEARRLKTDQRATADAVLSRLRPRMSLARPPRRSTPQRLFCMPFEDLLYDPGTPRKAIGRIPRSAIMPIWSLIAKHANPSVLEATSAILKSAEPNDRQAWHKAGTALWAEAARVLSERDAEARKTPTGRARLRDALGGEPVLSSLDDIYALMSVATTILELRSALPPAPIETIDQKSLAALVHALRAVAGLNKDAIPHVIFVLMARLRDLSILGELFERLTEAGVGDLVQLASGQAGEAVVSQAEDRMLDVRVDLRDEDLPKADVARELGREIDALERAAVAVGGGRAYGRRIERVKAEFAQVAREIVVAGASEATLAAVAALDDPISTDEEELQRLREAEDRVVALRVCRRFSNDAGMSELVEKAMQAIADGLEARGDDLLRKLAADDPDTSVIDLYNTVRLIELVEGSEKADRLRVAGLKAISEA